MSTDEYVPSDNDVRESYVHGETCDREGGVWDAEVPGAQERFTRWLTAHDARVRRDAWEEGAQHGAARPGYYPDENPYVSEETP